MTPEYLEELADPDQLWRTTWLGRMDLPPEKRKQLDAGVALRRHADHIRRLRDLLGTGKSLLITPLSLNGVASKAVATPPDHKRLLKVGG